MHTNIYTDLRMHTHTHTHSIVPQAPPDPSLSMDEKKLRLWTAQATHAHTVQTMTTPSRSTTRMRLVLATLHLLYTISKGMRSPTSAHKPPPASKFKPHHPFYLFLTQPSNESTNTDTFTLPFREYDALSFLLLISEPRLTVSPGICR